MPEPCNAQQPVSGVSQSSSLPGRCPQAPGVVVALPGEARSLARLRSMGDAPLAGGGHVMLAGLGALRAAAAAERLVARGVDGLVSWGTAAAIVPGIAPGDLLLAREVLNVEQQRFSIDSAWRQRMADLLVGRVALADGLLVESHEMLVDMHAKQRVQQATQAAVCDMESAAIAGVAARHGLPFLVVRAVVDDHTMVLPPAARAAVSEAGALQPVALARSLLGRPTSMHAQLRSLKHLGVAFRAARISLGEAATALKQVLRA